MGAYSLPHTKEKIAVWLRETSDCVIQFIWLYIANNSIQHAGVQYILDSVVQALAADPTKTFIYVEIAFFARWWDEQNDDTKALVC